MPEQPDKPIEEQLKAWARKRRDEAGAPFELHPATRKLLQDEVIRTFAKPATEPPPVKGAWWNLLWPRLALAGSICALLVILFGLSGPTLFKSKSKSERIAAVDHLKQIGLAARIYASDHDGRLPANFEQMRDELGGAVADKVIKDPESGKVFVYLGAGKVEGDRSSILAYAPIPRGRRPVLLGDGYVQEMDETQFNEALQRTLKGQTTIALAAATRAPGFGENRPAEREVRVASELKDARAKAEEPPAKLETRRSSEKRAPTELASADKRKEITGATVETAAVTSRLNVQNEREKAPLGERYGLIPAQAGGVTSRADSVTEMQKPSALPVAAAPSALGAAHARGGVVGGGGAGGTAGATNPAALADRADGLANPNGATTNAQLLALTRQGRVAGDKSVTLLEQREADRSGTDSFAALYARVPAAPNFQNYAQLRSYRVNFNSPPMPNVLKSFKVEQSGRQIRVLDADGSVYEGAIEPPPLAVTAKSAAVERSRAIALKKSAETLAPPPESASSLNAGQVAPQNVFFRVAGTNRTLNQLVVFQGNFLPNTNRTNGISVGAQLGRDQAATLPQQNWSQQSRQGPDQLIQGQATIGASNRIEINAAPVARPE